MTVMFSKSILTMPVLKALIVQCISLLVTFALIEILAAFGWRDVALYCAVLLQGLVASGISWRLGMASWWWLIQLVFPIACLLVFSFHLPPVVFLFAFMFMLALYWTTFQTQVPFYPSNPATWKAVADLLPREQAVKFIDIGSGLGGLVMYLDACRPDCDFSGIEVAPLPWLVSWVRRFVGRRGCRFERGDYNRLNFSHYDVVFAYLSPAAMPALWEKAHAEMRPGTLLISYEFPIEAKSPDTIIQPSTQGAQLYCWRIESFR